MRYSVEDIIKDVRICFEENATSDFLTALEDVETLELDQLIKSKISDAVRLVETQAPVWMVEGKPLPIGRGGTLAVADDALTLGGERHTEVEAVSVRLEDEDENTFDGGINMELQAVDEVDSVVVGRDGHSSVMGVGTGINWTQQGDGKHGSSWTGWLWLPKDFLKLLVFEMSDWNRPVFDAIGSDSARYAQQKSGFAGVRGNVDEPVVAVVPRTNGMVLEFYSCDSEQAKVVNASYLPMPQIVDEGIFISVECYRPAVYMAASLVAMSRGDESFSRNLGEAAKAMI